MSFLSKLHSSCQSTVHWLTNVHETDENCHAYPKSSSNLMKMLLVGAVASSIFGFYEFSQTETYQERETWRRPIVITTLGLGGTAVIIAKTFINFIKIYKITISRDLCFNSYQANYKFQMESKKLIETIKGRLEEEKEIEKRKNKQTVLNNQAISIIDNQKQQCSIVMIPEEIIKSIFQFLDLNDILKVSLTCKKWFIISSSDTIWKPLITQRLKREKEAESIEQEAESIDLLGRNGYISHSVEKRIQLAEETIQLHAELFIFLEQVLSKPIPNNYIY